MRVVIQRSKNSNCIVDERVVSSIDKGFVILVGFTTDDNINDINYLVKKIINLRVFNDDIGLMNKSILDINGSILSISQFTLYADTKKGNRPSFINAMKKDDAIKLYELFNQELSKYVPTYSGVFGADMKLNIYNDGPVTIIIDSKER